MAKRVTRGDGGVDLWGESGQIGLMKVAKLSELKNHLSQYVAYVQQGERVRILVRGVAVAELVPISDTPRGAMDTDELDDLERRGLIRRGSGLVPDELLEPGPPAAGKALSRTIVEERRQGR